MKKNASYALNDFEKTKDNSDLLLAIYLDIQGLGLQLFSGTKHRLFERPGALAGGGWLGGSLGC